VCRFQAGECLGAQLSLQGGEMSVQRAGTDIGAARSTRDAGGLDLDFYDRFFQPGAYLRTRAEHMRRWHAGQQGG
jgi:hypothetical protein